MFLLLNSDTLGKNFGIGVGRPRLFLLFCYSVLGVKTHATSELQQFPASSGRPVMGSLLSFLAQRLSQPITAAIYHLAINTLTK